MVCIKCGKLFIIVNNSPVNFATPISPSPVQIIVTLSHLVKGELISAAIFGNDCNTMSNLATFWRKKSKQIDKIWKNIGKVHLLLKKMSKIEKIYVRVNTEPRKI